MMPHSLVSTFPTFLLMLVLATALQPVFRRQRTAIERMFRGNQSDRWASLRTFAVGEATHTDGAVERLGLCLAEAVGARWCLVALDDGYSHMSPPDQLDATPATAEDGVTILLSGRAVGWLWVGPRENGLPYNREERSFLETAASQAALLLVNARLHEARLAVDMQAAIATALETEHRALLKQVVHDLRTDLANVLLAADLARETPEESYLWDSMARSCARMRRFLVAKAEGRAKVAVGSMRTALNEACIAMKPKLDAQSQWLDVDFISGDPLLPLDNVALEQIMLNLLDNASKFSPPVSGIHVTVQQEDDDLVVSVTDAGPGIPAHLLADLGSGVRADTDAPGRGLGLQNVQHLLAAVDGRLTWQNQEKGATFTVAIPIGNFIPADLAAEHRASSAPSDATPFYQA